MSHRAIFAALVLSVLAGCATAPTPPDGTVSIELSKDDVAACNDEGGCVIVNTEETIHAQGARLPSRRRVGEGSRVIDLQQFASCIGCTPELASVWHQPFLAAMAERAIDTPVRIAAFLAQVGHESGSLSRFEESLNYSAQRLTEVWPNRFPSIEKAHYYEHSPERLANLVYGGRMGNGGYESGDGWRYRGRGPIQITGCTNYRRLGAALNLPLIEQPDLLLKPEHGARSAAWFWADRGGNACASDCEAVTRLINGGTAGLADRKARFAHALQVLA